MAGNTILEWSILMYCFALKDASGNERRRKGVFARR